MNTLEQKAIQISNYIVEYFELTKKQQAKPKDLMPFLIQKKVFIKDQRNGLPLRNIFRSLEKGGKLDLIPHIIPIYKNKNISWLIVSDPKLGDQNKKMFAPPKKLKHEQIKAKKNGIHNSELIKTIPYGSNIFNMQQSSIKLIPIANLMKKLLEKKFYLTANYSISKIQSWLPCTPRKEILPSNWKTLCELYKELNGFNLELDEVLEKKKNELLATNQEIDIWFEHPYNFAVEFDEDQHFNQFRKLTLEYYSGIKINYDLNVYKELANKIVKPGKKTNGFVFLKRRIHYFLLQDQNTNKITAYDKGHSEIS